MGAPMAKNLALVALLLCIAALFLPLSVQQAPGGGEFTRGILMGSETKVEGMIFVGPAMFSTLIATLMRGKGFGRGLGVLNLLFGLATAGFMSMLYSEPRAGVELGLGSHAALGAGVLAMIAGVIGLIKPERR